MAPTDDLTHHNVLGLDGLPLCVECLHCHRRVLVPADRLRSPTIAEMESLIAASRRMKCLACDSRAVKVQRPFSLADAQEWLLAPGARTG